MVERTQARQAVSIMEFGQPQIQSLSDVRYEQTLERLSRDPRHAAAAKLQARIDEYLRIESQAMASIEDFQRLQNQLNSAQTLLIFEDLSSFQMLDLHNELGQIFRDVYAAPPTSHRPSSRVGRTVDLVLAWLGL